MTDLFLWTATVKHGCPFFPERMQNIGDGSIFEHTKNIVTILLQPQMYKYTFFKEMEKQSF